MSRPGIEDLRGGALVEVDSEVEEERAVGSSGSGSGSSSLVEVRAVRTCDEPFGRCLFLEMAGGLDLRLLALLGLTGKNMARENS